MITSFQVLSHLPLTSPAIDGAQPDILTAPENEQNEKSVSSGCLAAGYML
jgi:hypothetical protein